MYTFGKINLEVFFSKRQISAEEEVWHRRLGHPNSSVLNFLHRNKFISVNKHSQELCESCQLSKSVKLPFFSSDVQFNFPLNKIHSDLLGPAPISSVQNFRFNVVFIDDYSLYSWVYPLKRKLDFY